MCLGYSVGLTAVTEEQLLLLWVRAVVVSCKADIEKNSKFGDAFRTLGTSGTLGTFFYFQIKHQDPGELWELLELLETLRSFGISGTLGMNEVPKVPKVPGLYFENQKLI